MGPLAAFAARLREAYGAAPDPDPANAGVDARLLVLLETPGPRVLETGFVSQDNPSATGANLRRFLAEAGVRRRTMFLWNAVPWVIHAPGARNRAPRPAEVREGLALLPGLLALLPHLRAAVLLGRVAREAEPVIAANRPGLPVWRASHPSPVICCTDPEHPRGIIKALSHAAERAGPPRV
ncbi:MAG: uracil-DNA glycosylase [Caulobacteraceae bacterium]|nr:uracil-DNA glycosylase [Caulobacter sp.]